MEVTEEESHRKWVGRDFPGPLVNNPFSNAGEAGSIPGWGTKIPRDMGQLHLCVAAPGPMPQLERSLFAPTRRPGHAPRRKSPHAAAKNPAAHNWKPNK